MLKSKQNQQGRTILETLAAMAIMILLAILSISWFRGTIVRQGADRDYEDIQLFVSAVRNRGTTRTDSGMADAFLSYKKTRSGKNLVKIDDCPENTKGMTIQVDDIDDKTCERLMQKKWDGPFKSLLFLRAESGQNVCSWNGTDGAGLYRLNTPEDCTKAGAPEKGAFAVVFNDKRDNVVPCSEDTECGECEYCSSRGICESACTEEQSCAREFETPGTPKECYPTDHIVDGVYCANPDGEGNCCDSKGENCCPPDKPIMGKNGTCYGCDENVIIEVDERKEKCTRCSNRSHKSARYSYIGWCVPDECPEGFPLMNYQGQCFPCDTATYMKDVVNGRGDTSACSQCSGNAVFDDRICLICPNNMVVQDGQCVCGEGYMAGYPNNNYNSKSPTCHSCSSDNLTAIAYMRNNTQNPCSACPDRAVVDPKINYYNYCALETCPSGYMHDRYGHCKSCTQSANIEFKPSSLENSCSECGGMRYTDGNYCKKCPVDTSGLTEEQQAECTNDCLVYNATTKIWENKCTKVEYLESTGTQYIDTGIIPTKNLSFDATFENPNSPCSNASGCGNVFGTRKGSGNNEYQLTLYGGSIGVGTRTSGLKFYANVMNHISFDGNETVDINGTKKTIEVSDINDVGTIVLFAIRNLSSVIQYQKGKIYSVKFGNVRDFIPVLDPNGVPAMYDQVEKKLYYNAGTGTFSYGPVVN